MRSLLSTISSLIGPGSQPFHSKHCHPSRRFAQSKSADVLSLSLSLPCLSTRWPRTAKNETNPSLPFSPPQLRGNETSEGWSLAISHFKSEMSLALACKPEDFIQSHDNTPYNTGKMTLPLRRQRNISMPETAFVRGFGHDGASRP